ncbi:MAG: mechanosensitive ion channel [Candidatus Latescibacteria bacterium]|nr:mechanosensitive ion channel [bacterium]MBD3423617.1 mechanosensitive ion channel [Candidatus Latescibacterota bacterium]
MSYGSKLILAVLVLIIGLWIIRILSRLVEKAMLRHEFDLSLQKFLVHLISISLKAMLFISVISMVGVKTTSFVAVLGAAGLALGFALQGSLSNFAGGVMILLFKPFKIGDVIETQGYTGSVVEIRIFNTIIKTFDNKKIIVPNGAVSSGSITNYTAEPTRRVDMTFGIGYDDDIARAKSVLKGLVDSDERILKDPAPMIVVAEHADSSVNLYVRPWCRTEDYWGIYFDMHEKVKLAFDREGISIPYPQQDVHLHREG